MLALFLVPGLVMIAIIETGYFPERLSTEQSWAKSSIHSGQEIPHALAATVFRPCSTVNDRTIFWFSIKIPSCNLEEVGEGAWGKHQKSSGLMRRGIR